MNPPREVVVFLCEYAQASFENAKRAGDPLAESSFGWLCGFLQAQIQARPDEFVELLAGGLDDELRQFLGGDHPS